MRLSARPPLIESCDIGLGERDRGDERDPATHWGMVKTIDALDWVRRGRDLLIHASTAPSASRAQIGCPLTYALRWPLDRPLRSWKYTRPFGPAGLNSRMMHARCAGGTTRHACGERDAGTLSATRRATRGTL